MIFLALTWTIWRIRYKIIFQQKVFDGNGCFELCKANLVWRVKAERGERVPLVGDIVWCTRSVEIPSKHKKRKGH